MPIRKDRMKLYPGGGTHSKEWKAFRASLIERAGNRCEGTPHHPECRAENGNPHPETGSKVVLTIAHMDHDEAMPILSVAAPCASGVICDGTRRTMPRTQRSQGDGSPLRSISKISFAARGTHGTGTQGK